MKRASRRLLKRENDRSNAYANNELPAIFRTQSPSQRYAHEVAPLIRHWMSSNRQGNGPNECLEHLESRPSSQNYWRERSSQKDEDRFTYNKLLANYVALMIEQPKQIAVSSWAPACYGRWEDFGSRRSSQNRRKLTCMITFTFTGTRFR